MPTISQMAGEEGEILMDLGVARCYFVSYTDESRSFAYGAIRCYYFIAAFSLRFFTGHFGYWLP